MWYANEGEWEHSQLFLLKPRETIKNYTNKWETENNNNQIVELLT